MKKAYETPSVEVVKFQYKDQVVAASGGVCSVTNVREGNVCVSDDPVYTHKTGAVHDGISYCLIFVDE